MMMAVGALMGLLGLPLPGVEIGIAFSALLLGLMVLAEMRPKLAVSIAMVGFFAIFHGHAHGTELSPGQNAMLYSLGFVTATGTLHAVGISIGQVHRWGAGRLALRGAGSLVMAGGLFFLWGALL